VKFLAEITVAVTGEVSVEASDINAARAAVKTGSLIPATSGSTPYRKRPGIIRACPYAAIAIGSSIKGKKDSRRNAIGTWLS
jgi:hypothetical protein